MNVWQDVRYGLRTLRNAPGFAVTAVLTMGLGIGVTTAIFTVCDALLWKPVPLPHLESLVAVLAGEPGDPNRWNVATPADIDDIRRESTALAGLASWQGGLANLLGSGGEPERVIQSLVNANFFEVVGVQPVIGRGFQVDEDQPGRDREVILSDGLWRRRFGGDPKIVGQTILLDDQNYLVTGVMPPSFDFPVATEIWTPMGLTAVQRASRRNQSLQSIARLKPGAQRSRPRLKFRASPRIWRSFIPIPIRTGTSWSGRRSDSSWITRRSSILSCCSVRCRLFC